MKAIVVGGGVIGVTTAWTLAQDGHQVTIIEEQDDIAAMASRANGGQLSYDFASPMASPEMLTNLISVLLNKQPAFQVKHPLKFGLIRWGSKFAIQCLPQLNARSNRQLSILAKKSSEALEKIVQLIDIDFNYRKAGKLVIYSNKKQYSRDQKKLQLSAPNGKQLLNYQECLAYEPALNQCPKKIIGGILAKDDALGDAAQFSKLLAADASKRLGVSLMLNTRVTALEKKQWSVTGIRTDTDQSIAADIVILCSGNGTQLLKAENIKTNIFPVRGYSVTYPVGKRAPEFAITDHEHKVVYSRIGDKIRIAGFADFGFQSARHDQQRIDTLEGIARTTFPEIADYSARIDSWAGDRPATPNNLPVVGRSHMSNLFLNMGHGMFGWTLAAITAKQLVQEINLHEKY